MPSALKTADAFGDDLVVLFVESQLTKPDATERFIWNHKWMQTGAMWTNERPVRTDVRGIPSFVLLSAQGEVVLKGHPDGMHREIKEAIEEEIKNAKRAPEGMPKILGSAYKFFARGDWAKALEETDKITEKGGENAQAANKAAREFHVAMGDTLKRIDWMLANGYPLQAEALFHDVGKKVRGTDAFGERLAALQSAFDADEMKDELGAARAFTKIENVIKDKGLEKGALKKLERFVKKHGDRTVAARANRLLELAKGNG